MILLEVDRKFLHFSKTVWGTVCKKLYLTDLAQNTAKSVKSAHLAKSVHIQLNLRTLTKSLHISLNLNALRHMYCSSEVCRR